MAKLKENNNYVESAEDFYGKQNTYLENSEEFNKMGSLYNERINQILDKKYENLEGKSLGERLLKKVIRDGNKIQFLEYLKYLVDSGKIKSNNKFDDVDQIGDLQDKLKTLKEETEIMGPRDFEIAEGNIGSYTFKGRENIKYVGNNKYILRINFSKIKRKKITSWLKLNYTRTKTTEIGIEYKGDNIIKYYNGTNFSDKNLIGQVSISHKEEYVENKKEKSFSNYGRNHEYTQSKTISYIKGAEIPIYLKELGIHLKLKFFKKLKTD